MVPYSLQNLSSNFESDAAESLNQPLATSLQSTFSLFSPIGIAIGIALTETVSREEDVQSPGVIALQGLATGTLLYVVFFELLEKERQKKGVNSLIQVRTEEADLTSFSIFISTQRYQEVPDFHLPK